MICIEANMQFLLFLHHSTDSWTLLRLLAVNQSKNQTQNLKKAQNRDGMHWILFSVEPRDYLHLGIQGAAEYNGNGKVFLEEWLSFEEDDDFFRSFMWRKAGLLQKVLNGSEGFKGLYSRLSGDEMKLLVLERLLSVAFLCLRLLLFEWKMNLNFYQIRSNFFWKVLIKEVLANSFYVFEVFWFCGFGYDTYLVQVSLDLVEIHNVQKFAEESEMTRQWNLFKVWKPQAVFHLR